MFSFQELIVCSERHEDKSVELRELGKASIVDVKPWQRVQVTCT